jgi:hypothetical protein
MKERPMYIKRIFACAVLVCLSFQTQSQTPIRRIVIAASTILDGKGHVLKNTRIVVEGSKIVAIDRKASPVDYDLRGLTVLPGWIDAHAHITWSFGKDGKNAGPGETTQDAAYRSAANAWATLMAGFTTVQSVGSPTDLPVANFPAREYSPQSSHSSAAVIKPAHPIKSAPSSENRKKAAPMSLKSLLHRASARVGN